jgi:hypothetical protein
MMVLSALVIGDYSQSLMIPHKNDKSPFFTPAQLANRWQCSLMKLRRMRQTGTLGVTYIGRSARYSLADVERIETDSRA